MIFPILAAISTKPGDLVNALYARAGHAFVPETQAAFTWDFRKARRDEITLANYAANRWNLRVPQTGGAARGLNVPIDQLFDHRVTRRRMIPRRPFVIKGWLRPGGTIDTVENLLLAAGLPAERCHWLYRSRRLQMRVDPERLEATLPDLAVAVGGRYDVATKSIAFEPRAFREHVRGSISEEVYRAEERSDLELGLTRIGILHSTDVQLQALFAQTNGSALIPLDTMTVSEQECARRYFDAAFRIIDGSGGGQGAYLRSEIDFKRAPRLALDAYGVARLSYIGHDGKTTIDL